MEHIEWFDRLPSSPKPTNAAKAARIQPTTLIRQLERGEISANNVILLARAYNANIIQALVDTGYVKPEEVEQIGIDEALDQATNRQFLDAIWRRTDKDPKSRTLMGIRPGVINPAPDFTADNVRNINSNVPTSEYDGTVREFDYSPDEYAADSSPDENEERIRRDENPID
ncbi:DNA-binding protein [Corynebacterium diphtheriae]